MIKEIQFATLVTRGYIIISWVVDVAEADGFPGVGVGVE
jgi:hypothetical protein